jgi:hypothetical protein
MIEAMKQWREALACALSDDKPYIERCKQALKSINQAIAEAEKQEPYGWVSQHTTKGMYEWQFNKELSGVYKDTAISILPVYTYPQPKREPLTDEQILRFLSRIDECAVRLPRGLREFARSIEAAHGIKENT